MLKNGIKNEVSLLLHNTQIRPTTNIVISEEEAHNYIKNSVSSLEEVLTKYYDVFPTSSKYTGYTSDVPLGTFYETMLNKNTGTVAIYGKESKVTKEKQNSSKSENDSTKSSSNKKEKTSSDDDETSWINKNNEKDSIIENNAILNGDRGTINVGLAVFKNDKFVGTLSPEETLWYSLLKNEVDKFLVSIDNPNNENEKIDISLNSLSSVYFDVDVSSNTPKINIKFNLNGKIINNTKQISIYKENNAINDNLKKYLENKILDYLYKSSKEYNSDIECFYKIAKKEFLTNTNLDNYNWEEKYKNAEFKIEFNDDIITNLLIE